MIDLRKNTMTLGAGEKPIEKWVVWFYTMKGYHTTLEEALIAADETDMPPEMIRPVPVALTIDGTWEPAHR